MNLPQTLDIFSTPVFHRENNSVSQERFEQDAPHFTDQCKIVFCALSRGEKLTTRDALIKYGVGDLRRRIKDLIDIYKINVKAEYVAGTRFKQYYL